MWLRGSLEETHELASGRGDRSAWLVGIPLGDNKAPKGGIGVAGASTGVHIELSVDDITGYQASRVSQYGQHILSMLCSKAYRTLLVKSDIRSSARGIPHEC